MLGLDTHTGVCGSSSLGPTDRFGLPVFLCRTCEDCTATFIMDISYGYGPLRVAADTYHCMRPSNDLNQDKIVDLTTLGVVDLDTSMMPDVSGLWPLDSREPVVWVLPRDFLNLVHVLVPDATAVPMGFHDIIIEDLSGTPDYRARRIVHGDVSSLRRRWPSTVFVAMHKRQADMESLHRDCKQCYESEFGGGGGGGTCPHCGVYIICNISRHIMDYHLELGQLWRCPVEWCSIWKGSVQDCLDHLRSKHDGAQLMALKSWESFPPPPPRTVLQEFWCAALRPDVSGVATDVKLFHEAECRLVHRYQIYQDPMPHVSLQGKVMAKLHAFVNRTMVVTQLTHLHLSIPSSGMTTEPMSPECFPVVPLPRKSPKVSFTSDVEVIESQPTLLSPGEVPSVLSPIAHDSSVDALVTGVPVSMAPVASVDDSCHLESLLDRSFPQSRSYTSVQSTLRPTPILDRRFGRECPFVAKNPHPRIGNSRGGCAFRCTTYRKSDFVPPPLG